MRFFKTSQSEIMRVLGLKETTISDNQALIPIDFSRIQIPGELYIAPSSIVEQTSPPPSPRGDSKGETDSEASTIEDRSPSISPSTSETELASLDKDARQDCENFFLNYFGRENISYQQGMMTGSVVDMIILKQAQELGGGDAMRLFKKNTRSVNFCYKADNDTWQGVNLRIDLKTRAWYAVITDFSSPDGQVAIIGEGSYYQNLKQIFSAHEITEVSQLNDFIKNEHVKEAIMHTPIQLEMTKIKKSNCKEIYLKCLLTFLVKCGCSSYANFLVENNQDSLNALGKPDDPSLFSRFSLGLR